LKKGALSMKICYRYFAIKPLKDHYIDDGHSAMFNLDIDGVFHDYEIALLGTNGTPDLLRIAVKNLPDENIPETALVGIQMLKEHFISIYHLNYDREIELSFFTVWNFIDECNPPALNFRIGFGVNKVEFNPEKFKNEFNNLWSERETIKLLTEGIDERLPLYYRYLSLYRILEMLYKNSGTWSSDYKGLLSEFNKTYHTIKQTGRTLEAYIEIMRNRCAHGRFRNKKGNDKGLTQLDNRGLVELNKFMPLMLDIVSKAVNKKIEGLGLIVHNIQEIISQRKGL